MKSMFTDYFPAKLAKAPRFCNRLKERELLANNIQRGRHTVLVSPRRYGKSSLVNQVMIDMRVACASIDLFLAHDGKAITRRILDGVSNVISQIMLPSQKTLGVIQGFFSRFKITIEAGGFGLQFAPDMAGFDPVEQIFTSLKSLDQLAESQKKKILIFIDEFQDITSADNSKAIQGAIRHVAQDSSSLVFIFSGSNRHLLLELFDDKNKPLYMICDKMFLDRMSSVDYDSYIQDAAKGKWGKSIPSEVLYKILELTELHPFYVNLLGNELWKGDAPYVKEIAEVLQAWTVCYEVEERRLITELDNLTSNQQDVLKSLAQAPVDEPSSRKFLDAVGLSLSSVRACMKSLLEKDMVYRVKKEDINIPSFKEGQYRVLDPLLAYALRKYS